MYFNRRNTSCFYLRFLHSSAAADPVEMTQRAYYSAKIRNENIDN